MPSARASAFFASRAKPTPGDTLEAFVGRGYDGVRLEYAQIDGDRAEGAHGIDDQAFVRVRDNVGDFGERIEYPRRGFTMNGGDMGDIAVLLQQFGEMGGVGVGHFPPFHIRRRAGPFFHKCVPCGGHRRR